MNYQLAWGVLAEVKKAVTGKDDSIMKAFAAILAGGHILIEDVPGVGKTTLALAFSKTMALKSNRVQFTPDVMPADILGFNMYDKESGTFKFHPGTVICNLFLADEINRTSPKTQSALLEVMEENIITVDGKSYKVPEPFIVMATENPKGSAGTQLLPESQLDRFMVCMSMGYPTLENEIEIAKGRVLANPINSLKPKMNSTELAMVKGEVKNVYIHDKIIEYIAKLVQATREHPFVELGVSPRGTIALTRMVKAWAYLQGRAYVAPSDVEEVFESVCAHRLVLSTRARVAHVTQKAVLDEILGQIKQPASYMERSDYRE